MWIWYECSKCNRLKDIKEFSNQLMKIIENRDLEELNLYSKKIFDAAEKFNSSEIRDLLRLFPEIIEKYRRETKMYDINNHEIKILLVDDTAQNLEVAGKILDKEGYDIYVADMDNSFRKHARMLGWI